MAVRAIVSYDGTDNDADAVALGRLLRRAGAEVTLAYVRHAPEPEPDREVIERRKAGRLLDAGAALLGPPEAEREVVLSASTPEGLSMLATDVDADLIVFGSEYRTRRGRVEPGSSAQRLLEGGATAVAVAPAGLRTFSDSRLDGLGAVRHEPDGGGAAETAAELAEALGGSVVEDAGVAELLVIGSRADGPAGRVLLSATSRQRLEDAAVPVIVLPQGTPLRFTS